MKKVCSLTGPGVPRKALKPPGNPYSEVIQNRTIFLQVVPRQKRLCLSSGSGASAMWLGGINTARGTPRSMFCARGSVTRLLLACRRIVSGGRKVSSQIRLSFCSLPKASIETFSLDAPNWSFNNEVQGQADKRLANCH